MLLLLALLAPSELAIDSHTTPIPVELVGAESALVYAGAPLQGQALIHKNGSLNVTLHNFSPTEIRTYVYAQPTNNHTIIQAYAHPITIHVQKATKIPYLVVGSLLALLTSFLVLISRRRITEGNAAD